MSVKYLLAVGLSLFLVGASNAQTTVSINESSIIARTEPGKLNIEFDAESSNPATADLGVELLDDNDVVLDRAAAQAKLKRGANKIPISLKIKNDDDVSLLIWHRIRYSLSAGGETRTGILSLSEILPELFAIRLANFGEVRPGSRFPVRVYAYHPVRKTAIADVDVSAELEIEIDTDSDDDTLVLKGESRTDAEGFAEIVFFVPETVKFDGNYSAEINITGHKNGLKETNEEDLQSLRSATNVYFTTDKPLYQPGQTFHARALVMRERPNDSAMTIVSGLEMRLSIKDEDGTVLNRQNVKTSEFGIASIDWQIPSNAKLGTYRVEADAGDVEFRYDSQSFKISRYDLPNFVVQTKPDKDFYLANERGAEVTVDALYLFGKSVESGSVRVVREGSRNWNYREQKWEIEEEAVYEGKTDADGKYKAKIDLGPAQDNFKENEDSKFEDLQFTAYFTDSSTNRTEQRRFDLRITKEPVHVYVNKDRRGGDNNPKIPFPLYVTTFTADGKPLACEVEVTGKFEDESEARPLAKIRTSAAGAAKTLLSVPKRADDTYYDDLEIKIVARDAENRVGTEEFDYEIDEDEKQIRVTTDRAIYRKGESLKIDILASDAEAAIVVDILKGSSAIESRRVKTKNGRASLRIPYRPDFKGFLTISAYTDDDGDEIQSVWRVVYPDPRRLKVAATPDKEEYKPSEEAELSFGVTGFDKRSAESALGVVIVDQAVEERARTDSRYGAAPDVFASLREFDASNWTELGNAEVTPEMQLRAEMRFFDWYVGFEISDNYYGAPEAEFRARHMKQFEPLRKALEERFDKDFDHPTDDAGLRRILGEAGLDFDALRDPWGMPFRAQFGVNRNENTVTVLSGGPNKEFGDSDDFSAAGIGFDYFKKTGIEISEAIKSYETRTGTFVRDTEALRAALAEKGIAIESLIDRWGRPYRFGFGVDGRRFVTNITSTGEKPDSEYDDFWVFTYKTDYFADRRVSTIVRQCPALI